MELKQYLSIAARRWWLILVAFLVTANLTAMFVIRMPSVYESSGTLLLQPTGNSPDQIFDGSDLLIRGVKIGATYAQIARSRAIRDRAEAVIPDEVDTSDVDVAAEVLTDTNVISISATGPDARAAFLVAAAVSRETAEFVNSLDDTYVLTTLDAPSLKRSPIGPNRKLTMAIGSFFGLLIGFGLALLAHYLRGTPERDAGVRDRVTGAHNDVYIGKRLREEIGRSERTGEGFAMAVVSVSIRTGENGDASQPAAPRDLRSVAGLLQLTTRPETVVGHLGNGVFAILLPATSVEEAGASLAAWEAGIQSLLGPSTARGSAGLALSTGVCASVDGTFRGDRIAIGVVREVVGAATPGASAPSRPRRRRGRPTENGDGERVVPLEGRPSRNGDGHPAQPRHREGRRRAGSRRW